MSVLLHDTADDLWDDNTVGFELAEIYPLWLANPNSDTVIKMADTLSTTWHGEGLGQDTPGANKLSLYYYNLAIGAADYQVEWWGYNSTATLINEHSRVGPAARMSATLNTAYVAVYERVRVTVASTWTVQVNLYKLVAGTLTLLGTYTVPGGTSLNDGGKSYKLRLTVTGSAISVDFTGLISGVDPTAGVYATVISVTDTAITAAGFGGMYMNGTFGWEATDVTRWLLYRTVANVLSGARHTMLTLDNYLAFLGGTTDLGADIPDWHYSTGFDLTSAPAVVKGLLVDATDTVEVLVAKTVDGTEPLEGRSQSIDPAANQDEVWEPGSGDLRGQKFRVEFSGASGTTLHRALWSRELVDEGHGG